MKIVNASHALPKVTILTPTKNRPGFLAQCAKYVAAQTYPQKLLEWFIVNGGEIEGSFMNEYLGGARIESVSGLALGTMRNWGCKFASGEIIVHFDDDDWHAPDRVERQVIPFLVRPQLELVATDDYYIGLFDRNPVLACKSVTWGLERYASGGSFAYRKRAWRQHPFANIPSGEDYLFARHIREARGLVMNVHDPDLFICVRHGQNTVQADQTLEATSKPGTAEHVKSMMGSINFEQTKCLANPEGARGGGRSPPPAPSGGESFG
jgi:glycosyltransferase involved in cell wall biosynthesis